MDLDQRAQDLLKQIIDEAFNQGREAAKREILDSLARVGVAETALVKAAPKPRAAKSPRSIPPHCLFPKCQKPHKGPKFSFMCEDHYGTPKRDKAAYLAEWKESRAK